ncbi:MAG: hypothetical protein A2Z20_01045 [Bdellovibrionales bacterium RBG_16_40_8]|nr:MAG: hypothetical protein A2Z20_01045 [Bdellovibrionales bacterium RBG_16_40_8]
MEHAATTLPWSKLIIPQLINFSIFIGALVYLLKTPLKKYFISKNAEFDVKRREAEEVLLSAEKENGELQAHLNTLENTANKSLEEAKKDSESLKKQIISQANEEARRLIEEAQKMAQFELLRATAMLKQEIIIGATDIATKELKKKVSDKTQERLNDDFITKIQALTQ